MKMRNFSWKILTRGACLLLLLASTGCLGGRDNLPIGGPYEDTINAHTCECVVEFPDRAMTDQEGNEGITVKVDADDATEAWGGAVTVFADKLEMSSGSLVGLRFTDIPIPRGSVIKSAVIEFTASYTEPDTTEVKIRVENSTDTVDFVEQNVFSRPITQGWVDWDITDVWPKDSKQYTPDFGHLIEEVVVSEWTGGTLVVIFETISGFRQPMSAQNGAATAPRLLIEFTPTSRGLLEVCLGEEIERCCPYDQCEDNAGYEYMQEHCETKVQETLTGLVNEAGYVPTDAQIRCEVYQYYSYGRCRSSFMSTTCEQDCLSNPLNNTNFDQETAKECINDAEQECRENGTSPDECVAALDCVTTYLSATHAGAQHEPICVAGGPFDTAIGIASQLFGDRSICDVVGETDISVSVDGEEPISPKDGPADTRGRLTILGTPCPGETCLVGFASNLGMEDIEFDSGNIFVPDPVFKDLMQTAVTYPRVAVVGDDTPGEIADQSVEAVSRGARGSEGGVFIGTNDSTNSDNPLSLTVNWTEKKCGLSGNLLSLVNAEGQPAYCEGDENRECFRDSDCEVSCVTPETGEPYCEGDVTKVCVTDADCEFAPCGELPMDEGVLGVDVQYTGILLNQPPRADASGPQTPVECTSPDGAEVELDGSGSSDPDHDISHVSWLKGGRLGDNVGDSLVATNLLALNEPTEYTLRVIDAYAQSDEDTMMVEVNDTTPPDLFPPPDVTDAECTATDAIGTEVELGPALASDTCDPEPYVSNNSPARFPRGDTTVTWIATDNDDNEASDDQLVTVIDTRPPDLTPPPDLPDVECTAPDAIGTEVELGTAEASDICDPEPYVSNNSPEMFILGNTTVTWTATDDYGNEVGAVQLVTVIDTTPPEISCNAPETIYPTDAGDDKEDPHSTGDPPAPVAFTATAVDTCDPEVPSVITDFDCFAYKNNGKRIDKTDSCEVTFLDDTITILDSGGVGTHITWTVTAEDDTGNPEPNTREVTCEVEVVKQTK